MELIDSRLGLLQSPASYCEDTQNNNKDTPPQLSDLSSQGSYGYNDEYNNLKTGLDNDDHNDLDKTTTLMAKSFHSGTLCGSSTVHALGFEATRNNTSEVRSLINFKSDGCDSFMQTTGGSLLSFQQGQADYMSNFQRGCSDPSGDVMNNYNYHHHLKQIDPKGGSSDPPRILEDMDCYQSTSSYGSMMTHNSIAKHGICSNGWLYSESTAVADSIQESGAQQGGVCKRSCTGESAQSSKKQCNGASKSSSSKSKLASSKDPQSIAAKNRRERISERLKTLQDLVPNGNKVDLVTMLEKAISYVKFLQLQVKVLATDEFWPVQGGKAPDISQVKEAIDAILSCQRDTNSGSK